MASPQWWNSSLFTQPESDLHTPSSLGPSLASHLLQPFVSLWAYLSTVCPLTLPKQTHGESQNLACISLCNFKTWNNIWHKHSINTLKQDGKSLMMYLLDQKPKQHLLFPL